MLLVPPMRPQPFPTFSCANALQEEGNYSFRSTLSHRTPALYPAAQDRRPRRIPKSVRTHPHNRTVDTGLHCQHTSYPPPQIQIIPQLNTYNTARRQTSPLASSHPHSTSNLKATLEPQFKAYILVVR
ncbi:unnamed protein product [Chondrus crispus]|uniref:Uncharacterized protein n=1 Tax=Chondrus crispus TaxID=2769 RepID=R7QCB9_CHOCR|nr:unnamed protein product [Chondrus crispus]CDF35105.1 unnamed protein product [Chondrus crispus]|eukprot:XP_005714924.1 unnamed protein product [Chondrus crispus]